MVAEGASPRVMDTVEARWIVRGQVDAPMLAWFGRFQSVTESREDRYLINPSMGELSVKIRGVETLDVKVRRGDRSTLEIPRRARGHVETWQKWSFPIPTGFGAKEGLEDWQAVRKTRRISAFRPKDDGRAAHAEASEDDNGCAVELTEIELDGAAWWTLGFEASGHVPRSRAVLEETAAVVFSEPMPAGLQLGPNDASSYASWLRRGLGP